MFRMSRSYIIWANVEFNLLLMVQARQEEHFIYLFNGGFVWYLLRAQVSSQHKQQHNPNLLHKHSNFTSILLCVKCKHPILASLQKEVRFLFLGDNSGDWEIVPPGWCGLTLCQHYDMCVFMLLTIHRYVSIFTHLYMYRNPHGTLDL